MAAAAIEEIIRREPQAGATPGAQCNCPGYENISRNYGTVTCTKNGTYCAYYALFNAKLMLAHNAVTQENLEVRRQEFKEFLRQKLTLSVRLGHNIRAWRDANELRQAIKHRKIGI